MKNYLFKLVRTVFNRLSLRILAAIEREAQFAQGFGIGAASVEREARAAYQLFRENFLEEIVFLDIGAFLGEYTDHLIGLPDVVRGYHFEPQVDCVEILKHKYSNRPNITIVNVALGSKSGSAELFADKRGSKLASLTKLDLAHFNVNFSASEECQVESLDNWCASEGVIPNFIKIDVEGHELQILHGSSDILRKVKLIQFEFGRTNIDTKTTFKELWKTMNNNGFLIFRIGPTRLVPILEYQEKLENYSISNYLALKKITGED